MVKQSFLDYRWHEYFELSFGFNDDDTMHVFVLPDNASAINAYVTAIENENIEWAAVHHIWYGRVLNERENSWQYHPMYWFGIEYALG